jgi:PAS domain S-box-containing protein
MRPLRTNAARYGLAVTSVVIACSFYLLFRGVAPVNTDVRYFGFGVAVAVSAFCGGFVPGLVSTAVAAFLAAYLLLPPIWSVQIASPDRASRLVLFVMEGVLISLVFSLIRSGRRFGTTTSRLAQYVSPFVFVGAATGLKLILFREHEYLYPFAFFYAAMAASSWIGSFAAGLIATLLSGLCARLFFLDPGHSFWIQTQNDVIRMSLFLCEGTLVSYLSAGDSNARRIASEAIKQLNEHARRLRMGVEDVRAMRVISRDMIWELDLGKARMTWGRTETERTKAPAATMDFTYWLDQIHPKDRLKVLESLRGALEDGRREWSCEYRRLGPGGKYGHVSDHAFIIRDESRHPLRVVGRSAEITEGTRISQALENEVSYRALFENNPRAILLADQGLHIMDANDAACDLLGYKRIDLTKLPLNALFDENRRGSVLRTLSDIDSIDGSTITFEEDCVRADGELFRAHVTETMVKSMQRMSVDRMVTIEELAEEQQASNW